MFLNHLKCLTLVALVFLAANPLRGQKLIIYRSDSLCGYSDVNGNIVIKPKYIAVTWFDEGYATVTGLNGKTGLIDSNGKACIPLIYDVVMRDRNGYVVQKSGKYGYYFDGFKKVISPKLEYLAAADGNHFILIKNGKKGVREYKNDKWGKTIIPFSYNDLYYEGNIKLFYDDIPDSAEYSTLLGTDSTIFFDRDGKIISPDFNEHTNPSDIGRQYGISEFENNDSALWNSYNEFSKCQMYKDSLKRWGYKLGDSIFIPPVYDSLVRISYDSTSCGVFLAYKNGLWGMVNKNNTWNIPLKYKYLSKPIVLNNTQPSTVMVVKKDSFFGIIKSLNDRIDFSGGDTFLLDAKYDNIEEKTMPPLNHGTTYGFLLEKDGKYGFLFENGILIEPEFSSIRFLGFFEFYNLEAIECYKSGKYVGWVSDKGVRYFKD